MFGQDNSSLQGKAVLKDGTEVIGRMGEKDYGKYVIIKIDENNQQVITWDQLKYIHEPKESWCWSFLTSLWSSLSQFAVIVGLIGFIVGLWQYGDAQKWKRAEFFNKEVGEYEGNQYVLNVQSVLASTGEVIELPPEDASKAIPSMVVDSNTLTRALASPDAAKPFTPAEKRIRESFDVFLSNLERFNKYIDSGLVRKKETDLYLSYWLKIMGDPKNDKITLNARTQLLNYINTNDYHGVLDLLKKFGYKTTSNSQQG